MPSTRPTSTLLPLLAAGAAAVLWGTSWIGITEFMPDDRPLLAATLRALPAGLVLLAIVRRLPSGSWWWRAGVLGTLNFGLFFALLTVAAYRVPGGVAATTGALQPLMVAAIALPLLGLLPTRAQVASGAAGIIGVALLVFDPGAAIDLLGVAAAVAAVASMALGLVLTKRWQVESVTPLVTTAWQLTAGGLMLLPASLLIEGAPPAPTVHTGIAVLWVGLLTTGVANWLWFVGLEGIAATQASFMTLLAPVVATAIGWTVLDETLSPVQVLGALVALASVAAGSRVARARAVAAPPATRTVSAVRP